MNERIAKLYDQAIMLESNGDYVAGELDPVKFAELIVQECIEVCNSRVGNSDYNTGRMHCASDIREHFGISE